MTLHIFHPAVARWFERTLGQPTDVQALAWPAVKAGSHTLIAAPTGSGKTLAAFLAAIDSLLREGLEHGLEDRTYILYISPLKALSNDIHKNLEIPLSGIRDALLETGNRDVAITSWVRTGDTPAGERERMRRKPPHILVTTPESLFIMLTSESGREMLSTVRTVIIDEIHALAGNKRGAHLALSLERLDALIAEKMEKMGTDHVFANRAPLATNNADSENVVRPHFLPDSENVVRPHFSRFPVRIGLSATQKPIEDMAQFLVGTGRGECAIVDTGYVRERDLAIEVPGSPLEAVMAAEVWTEVYDRLAELVEGHRTTLIFVNTRRLAERVARHLADRIGETRVTAHHGSLAREQRLDAEQRLKAGELKALVATASLELGIDVGEVNLVCQLGSPRAIAVLLQRVGRSGHAVGATPKGRLFPLSRDDLVECAALLDAVRQGELDRIRMPAAPLDVLAQQIVAEVASREWEEEVLYRAVRRALPYASLERGVFGQVVAMLAEGYSTRRGRRGAWLHRDLVNGRLRARRGARLAALTNAGAIPDQFDYDVILQPQGHFIGNLNEDFAFESLPGDIFQLGNTAYRMLRIEQGKVHVEDAKGQPPNLPFWIGEAPGRTDELSRAVSRLREAVDARIGAGADSADVRAWLGETLGLPDAAAAQLGDYLYSARAALGALPTMRAVVLERFFDEVGDMHLVIHAPFGARINRAWGLALRKRFCRRFNFELQAAATEDNIILSLGPTHSFPLAEVAAYLRADGARDILVQALLDAPMFGTRWRWVANIALAVLRNRGGRRVPAQFQRSDAEDLVAVVFPDQLACLENIVGAREVPDHPLVNQTLADCLTDVMDVEGFERVLAGIESGEIKVLARDLTTPSPLACEILTARPYAFLDDAPAEERRTLAVQQRRILDPETASDLGRLDPEAIARVRAEAWPDAASPDELHDALVLMGFLTDAEIARGTGWAEHFDRLADEGRAARVTTAAGIVLHVAAERMAELRALFPQSTEEPVTRIPGATADSVPDADEALVTLLRSRLEGLGPVTARALATSLGVGETAVDVALARLEAEGFAIRGHFDPALGDAALQWCERRLLARIHRYTLKRLRSEIEPVAPADFMRFLFEWQGLGERGEGPDALAGVLERLEGFAAPAAAWEEHILPARLRGYLPDDLDRLCHSGRFAWLRIGDARSGRRPAPLRTTPIAFVARRSLAHWRLANGAPAAAAQSLAGDAATLADAFARHPAAFFEELKETTGLLHTRLEAALAELAARGLVNADSFAGLRALIAPQHRRPGYAARRRGRARAPGVEEAGRWAWLAPASRTCADDEGAESRRRGNAVEHVARALLRRYGVVFRALLARESGLPPWRELVHCYRRLEARGEIRGGRFVEGFSGEQYALPEAVTPLRAARKNRDRGDLVAINAVDPANLTGIVTPGERIPALAANRVLYRDGIPVAALTGGEARIIGPAPPGTEGDLRRAIFRPPDRQLEAARLAVAGPAAVI